MMLAPEVLCLTLLLAAVYGKTTQQAVRVHGLQKGQRVCFDVKCVAAIQYHSDSDSDED